ncbi:MAG: hypothetical protein M0T80_04850 [Actinomycetota bacterium]|nr:hypothetical protein [Actinomycetota bacterium]MDA8071233.1 hypothetical protein [Actinomycetota bacterium]
MIGALTTRVERAVVLPDVGFIAQRARRLQRQRRYRRISAP